MNEPKIREVVLIYNPKSSGPGKRMSQKLQKHLKREMPDTRVQVVSTKYVRHATLLAEEHAGEHVLLLAVSGDGGYNEVINGAMKVRDTTGVLPICGVLPAGHANDHFRALSDERSLLRNLAEHRTRRVDLLKAEYTDEKGNTITRYAHSYIGLGASPYVVKELNEKELNNFNDKLIAAKILSKYQPQTIKHRGKKQQIDSLIFTNTGRMARWLTVSKDSKPDDGLFEVQHIQYVSPASRFQHILKMLQGKPQKCRQATSFTFWVDEKTLMQFDGEVVDVAPKSRVRIKIIPRAIRTIL